MHYPQLAKRFRGFLPVVIDLETGGFNPEKDAILEIAAVMLDLGDDGILKRAQTYFEHVLPFPGSNIEPESLEVTKIFDPYHPFRYALEEKEALQKIFAPVHQAIKESNCERAVLVGHNANFDLSFIQAACKRNYIKNNPFHSFTTFDTATLSALAVGETVLARAAEAVGIKFNRDEAHSAIYDAEKTADLFCWIVNRWKNIGGWKK